MDSPQRATPRARLTVLDAVALIVGIVFGIGIYKTPPLVAANVDSGLTFMALWVVGGFVTLVGALCYAELATAYPSAGGEYHFLSRAYGKSVAVLFAWARGTVVQTGAIALVAFVFGDYASQLLSLGPYSSAIYAVIAVLGLTAINLVGTAQGTRAQYLFTAVELTTIVVVLTAALFVDGGREMAATAPAGAGGAGGALGLAMVFVLLTYGGWNEAAYISAEMRDARHSIPRALVTATLVLVALYGLMNLAYLHALGLQGLRAIRGSRRRPHAPRHRRYRGGRDRRDGVLRGAVDAERDHLHGRTRLLRIGSRPPGLAAARRVERTRRGSDERLPRARRDRARAWSCSAPRRATVSRRWSITRRRCSGSSCCWSGSR